MGLYKVICKLLHFAEAIDVDNVTVLLYNGSGLLPLHFNPGGHFTNLLISVSSSVFMPIMS